MVIYYGVTTYQLLCCILHRLEYRPDSPAVLLVADNRGSQTDFINRLKKTDIFSEVYSYPNKMIQSMGSALYQLKFTPQTLTKAHQAVCRMVEKSCPITLKKEHEYFISPDYCSMGVYLVTHQIPYHYFEDGCGVLSRPDLLANVLKTSRYSVDTLDTLQLNGNNPSCIDHYADMAYQTEGFTDPRAVDFSVSRLLARQHRENIKKILYVFDANYAMHTNQHRVLLLTQPLIHRRILTFEEQRQAYALLMDYFCTQYRVYIKPHPGDVVAPYSTWFPSAVVYPAATPSELIPYFSDDTFDLALSISSTAVYSLGSAAKRSMCFNIELEEGYRMLHTYYTMTQAVRHWAPSNTEVYLLGANQPLTEYLLKEECGYTDMHATVLDSPSDLPQREQGALILVDHFDCYSVAFSQLVSRLNARDLLVVLDSAGSMCSLPLSSYVQALITVRSVSNEIDEENAAIYFYSKDEKRVQALSGWQTTKPLKNAGLTLQMQFVAKKAETALPKRAMPEQSTGA